MKEIECTSYLLLVSTTDEMMQEYVEPYIPVLSQTPESLEYLMISETDSSNAINDRLFEGNAVVEYLQQCTKIMVKYTYRSDICRI